MWIELNMSVFKISYIPNFKMIYIFCYFKMFICFRVQAEYLCIVSFGKHLKILNLGRYAKLIRFTLSFTTKFPPPHSPLSVWTWAYGDGDESGEIKIYKGQ